MTKQRTFILLSASTLVAVAFMACGDSADTTATSGTSAASASGGASSSSGAAGGSAGGAVGGGGSSGTGGAAACADTKALVDAYKAAHPGNGGKDWDINAKTQAELAADPDAQALLALCGPDQRPVIPLMAWEYGGNDHPWIEPEASALYYCVYIPINPPTENWQYDPVMDHVTADVYIGCPEGNPCKDKQGAEQVMSCLGDPTNIEILVDTASLNDGADAGLSLSRASTDLNLILRGGMKVHLYTGL